MLPLFAELHPNCELCFCFDNSQNHHARKPDALWAWNLNLSDGGKNIKSLRDTEYNGVLHKMQRDDGVQKGITILKERGLCVDGMKLICKNCKSGDKSDDINCCGRRRLSECDDFGASVCWLQDVINEAPANIQARMIFFPKFHCELNYIEMIWGYAKTYLRRRCTFNFSQFEDLLQSVLLQQIPLAFFKKAQRHCFRYMDGYRKGLTGPLLTYAVKRFKGHRMIPNDSIEVVRQSFENSIDKSKMLRR